MTTRQYFFAESAGEVTNTVNSTWSDVVTLTFTPDASSDYIIFWEAEGTNSSGTAADYRMRVRVEYNSTETIHAALNVENRAVAEYAAHGGFFRYQQAGSPATDVVVSIQVQPETGGQSAKGKNGRLVALRLESLDVYAESLARQTSVSTTMAVAVQATPLAALTNYIVLGSSLTDNYAVTVPVYTRFLQNALATAEFGSQGGDLTNKTDSAGFWVPTSGNTAAVMYQFRSHAAASTAGISDARILLLHKGTFDAAFTGTTTIDSSLTPTSYTNTLTTSPTISANPQMVIAQWHNASTTSGILMSSRFMAGGVQKTENLRRSYSNAAGRPQAGWSIFVEQPGAGARAYAIQTKSPAGEAIVTRAQSGYAVLDLGVQSGGGITATAALTDPIDTYGATGAVALKATAALTDPVDTFSATGAVALKASAALTDPVDAYVATGTVSDPALTASAALVDPADTWASAGAVALKGSAAVTDPADTWTGAAAVRLAGAAVLADPVDSYAATGALAVSGAVATTDAPDTFDAVGRLALTASAALQDAPDTWAATGGTVAPGISATAALVDPADGYSAAASVRVSGAVATTDAADTFASTGALSVRGSADLTDAPDAWSGAASLALSGSSDVMDPPDTLEALGRLYLAASADLTDEPDDWAGYGQKIVPASPARGRITPANRERRVDPAQAIARTSIASGSGRFSATGGGDRVAHASGSSRVVKS